MKNIYFLIISILMANTLFAQNKSQKAISNQLKLKAPFLNAYDTLPNGLVIDLESGEIIENNYLSTAFRKPNTEKKTTATKSAIKSTLTKYRVFSKTRMNSLNRLKSTTFENSSYQKDKIDSMVFYSVENTPEYDLKLKEATKTIIEKNDNGDVTMRVYQILDTISGNYINNEKKEYSFDGNNTKTITYDWNGELWTPSGKTEQTFNNNGKILEYKVYEWQTNTWIEDYTRTYTYHDNGEVESYQLLRDNGTLFYERRDEFNDDGEQTLYIYRVKYSSDTDWRIYDHREFNYNEDETILENLFSWDPETQQLIQIASNLYRFEETYEEGNLVDQIRYDYIDDEWIPTKRKMYDFDNNDNITANISFVFQNPDGWLKREEDLAEYDERGNQTYYEHKESIGNNNLRTLQKTITEYNDSNLRIKEHHYIWDEEIYALRDEVLLEWEYDENNQTTSYSATVWDTEEQQLTPYFKYIYSYPNELERISEYYEYEDLGKFSSNYAAYETLTFTYDSTNGRYTSIIDHYDTELSTTKFIYDENLKLIKRIELDENGEERDNKGNYYYDKFGRDSLWVMTWYYSPQIQDTIKWNVKFEYTDVSRENTVITEHWYDNQPDTIVDDSGEIIGYGDRDELIKYTFDNGNITKWIDYEKTENGWVADDSMMYAYNDAGQIQTSVYIGDYYKTKLEYILTNDTLILNEYWTDDIDSTNWEHTHKTIYLLDVSYSKNQIQHFPGTFFEDRMHYPIEWRFPYDYGKVLEIIYYGKQEASGELVGEFRETDKDVFLYSPAALLSGEGIIDGYIFEGEGTTKSVTTTAKNNGTPFEGVVVTLCAKENDFVLANDTTDENGFYQFKGVPDGDFYIKVEMDDYQQISTYNINVSWFQTQFENKNFTIQNGEVFTGINDKKQSIKVYPNPASDFIEINAAVPIISITITDTNGRCYLRSERLNSNTPTISVQSLSPGLYILSLETDSTNLKEKILVVN